MTMEIVKAKMGDFTGKLTVIIRGMQVSETEAAKVKGYKIKNVRTAISKMKKELPNSDYKAAEVEDGILIWRTA
jgi:hypothetical protein